MEAVSWPHQSPRVRRRTARCQGWINPYDAMIGANPKTKIIPGDNIPAGLVSVPEHMVGMLAASIPTYRPLYQHLIHGSAKSNQNFNSGYSRTRSIDDSFEPRTYMPRSVNISSGGLSNTIRPGGVNITNQIQLSVHSGSGRDWGRVPE